MPDSEAYQELRAAFAEEVAAARALAALRHQSFTPEQYVAAVARVDKARQRKLTAMIAAKSTQPARPSTRADHKNGAYCQA